MNILLVSFLAFHTAQAQSSDTPLDTTPLETTAVSISPRDRPAVNAPQSTSTAFFAFDPFARSRGVVVGTADVSLACAGAGPLRDAALACPLDHQLALRGLPDLLTACSAIKQGSQLPADATPVPHAATLRAAADARADRTARVQDHCRHQLDARRVGSQLTIGVPEASGTVEVRVGWRPQLRRQGPGDEAPPVTWLPPVYQAHGNTHRDGEIARTVDLYAMRPERGYWRFDLAVEVVDAEGAATRVVMPVDVAVDGLDGPVDLGPALEVSVGTGAGNLRLADLEIAPSPGSTDITRGRPGVDRTPQPGNGRDPSALDATLDACTTEARPLSPRTCARLSPAPGEPPSWPQPGTGPLVGAAARDDLIALPRQLGSRVLAEQLAKPAAEQAWTTIDAATVLAVLGGTLEAMVAGADPVTALAAWSRQLPAVLPDGRRIGFFTDDTHTAAPLASTLYVASLVAASAPEPSVGAPQPGTTLLSLASNLSWTDNLPGGLRAPWSGTQHPRIGTADLGWLGRIATALDTIRRTAGPQWERLRRGSEDVVAAIATLHAETTTALLSAAAGLPDQSGADPVERAQRFARLDRLLSRLPRQLPAVARGDAAGMADAALALFSDPALERALPTVSSAQLTQVAALARLAATEAPAPPTRASGLALVVGLSGGASGGGSPVGVAAWPTAALAWETTRRQGRSAWSTRVVVADAGAPWSWSSSDEVSSEIPWQRLFSPGLQLGWQPTGSTLTFGPDLRWAPVAGAWQLGVGMHTSIRLR